MCMFVMLYKTQIVNILKETCKQENYMQQPTQRSVEAIRI